jgi:TRAP-type transport system periplasmic protein
MKSRSLHLLAAATVTALLGTATAMAQETTLVLATTTPPNSPASAQLHHPWANRISEQGKGIIRIDVRDGPAIANPNNAFSRVMDDVVQIAPVSTSYVGGKFPLLEVVNLPLISDKSREASIAFWRLYKSGILEADFQDTVPLQVVGYPQAGMHLTKAPKSLDDLRGLRLQSGGKVLSDTLSKLGGTPLSLTVVDLYEALQRGSVDGTVIQYMTFPTFKFDEVTSYHVDFPFSSWPQMIFMSKKRHDGLSAAARKIIEENSGEAQSRRWGEFYDELEIKSRENIVAKSSRHTIVTLQPEHMEKWRQKVLPVIDEWVKSTPGGDKVLAAYRAELAKVKNESR